MWCGRWRSAVGRAGRAGLGLGRGREGPVAEQVGEPELGGAAHQDVPPELGGHDAQPVGHRRHGLRPDVVLDAVPDVPEQHPEEPAQHDDLGVDGVDGVPDRRRERGHLSVDDPFDLVVPLGQRRGEGVEVVGRGAGHGGQGAARGLGLQAPDRPAVAADAVRRDEGVPELARVPVGTAERSAGADDPATDAARAAVQVHQVVDTTRTAVEPLGPGAEVRVVRRADRQPETLGEGSGEGLVPPAEVRGVADDPVLDPDDARDGDADADEPQLRGRPSGQDVEQPGDGVDRDGCARDAGLRLDEPVAHGAVEGDECHRDGVDLDGDRGGHDVAGCPDDRARPPDPGGSVGSRGPGGRELLVHQAPLDELPDQCEHRRPVEPGAAGELGAGDGSALVHDAEDARDVAGRGRGRAGHGSSWV